MFLEVIATTAEDGVEAAAGGADRLEVVRELGRGGLTPPWPLVEALLARVRVPLRVMVRVEEPFIPTSLDVVRRMCDEARALAALPVDGLVFGALTPGGDAIDLDVLRRFADAAAPRAITFHRAFELAPDAVRALSALAGVPPVDRVLTAAGEGSADARVARLARWRDAAPSPRAAVCRRYGPRRHRGRRRGGIRGARRKGRARRDTRLMALSPRSLVAGLKAIGRSRLTRRSTA